MKPDHRPSEKIGFSFYCSKHTTSYIVIGTVVIGSTMENIIQKQWEEIDNKLYKIIIFKDFQEAFAFMVRVAFLAEKNNHHPCWKNQYNSVEIWLSTHDTGNIVTEKDITLAKEIDDILGLTSLLKNKI